jgi:hypothetical protein
MKIGFTGTQEGMNEFQLITLENRLKTGLAYGRASDYEEPRTHRVYEFHHGDCIGADAQAHEIALILGYRIVIHPPLNSSKRAWCEGWSEMRDKKPYLERNHNIVDVCDVLIVGPRTNQEELRSGTWSTYRYADSLDKMTSILLREENTTIIRLRK